MATKFSTALFVGIPSPAPVAIAYTHTIDVPGVVNDQAVAHVYPRTDIRVACEDVTLRIAVSSVNGEPFLLAGSGISISIGLAGIALITKAATLRPDLGPNMATLALTRAELVKLGAGSFAYDLTLAKSSQSLQLVAASRFEVYG